MYNSLSCDAFSFLLLSDIKLLQEVVFETESQLAQGSLEITMEKILALYYF